MNKKKTILFLPMLTLLLSSCSMGGKDYPMQDYIAGTLQFKEDFRILQLSDVHLGNKDNLEYHFDFMKKTIDDAHADLIVVTGDVFTFADKNTANKTFKWLDSFNTPWTMVWGNHDEQCYFSIDWLTGRLNSLSKSAESKCIFKDLQDDNVFGNSNFVINLTGSHGEVVQQLMFIDSNRYDFSKFKGYDAIHANQVDWYTSMTNYTKGSNTEYVPSLAFFHIPFIEFETAYNVAKAGTNPEVTFVGDVVKNDINTEGVACPKTDNGIFEAMKTHGTKGCFVGHDHVNTYCVNDQGVYLCYGIKATTRVYYDEELMGGQVINMNSAGKITIERIFHKYNEEA